MHWTLDCHRTYLIRTHPGQVDNHGIESAIERTQHEMADVVALARQTREEEFVRIANLLESEPTVNNRVTELLDELKWRLNL